MKLLQLRRFKYWWRQKWCDTPISFWLRDIRRAYARCEHCRGLLRKHGDSYFGAIDIKDSIGGGKTRTTYLCNLCYALVSSLL